MEKSILASSHVFSENIYSFLCVLCFRVIEKKHERYLVSGKSKFNVQEAFEQLPFVVSDICSSAYICRQCLAKLQKDQNSFHKREQMLESSIVFTRKERIKDCKIRHTTGQQKNG